MTSIANNKNIISSSDLKIKTSPTGSLSKKQVASMEFPSLGTSLTKAQTKIINSTNIETVKSNAYVHHVDQRTACFESMADKEKIAKSLTCTKACRIVTEPFLNPKDGEEKKFGVCTRQYCTFAHSIAELQVPACGFDGSCRFLYGKRDYNTHQIIPNTQCRFRHSNETIDGWLERSGSKRTPLPETNEHSRKPPTDSKPSKPTDSKPSKPTDSKPSKPIDSKPSKATIPPPKCIMSSTPLRKNRWDQKPVKVEVESESNSSESESESSSSESESSSSESESSSRRSHRSHSRRSHRSHSRRSPVKSSSQYLIEVPTKELAAIALKAAIEKGQYNIRVVVI